MPSSIHTYTDAEVAIRQAEQAIDVFHDAIGMALKALAQMPAHYTVYNQAPGAATLSEEFRAKALNMKMMLDATLQTEKASKGDTDV